jgi:hypothetical protein
MKRIPKTFWVLTELVAVLFAATNAVATQTIPKKSFQDFSFDYKSYSEERQLVWEELNLEQDEADEKEERGEESHIGVGIIRYDLNDDGRDDLLVRVDSLNNCGLGSHGCTFHILIQDSNWQYGEGIDPRHPKNIHPSIGILHHKTNGFHDLFLGDDGDKRGLWKWDGTKYAFDSVVEVK